MASRVFVTVSIYDSSCTRTLLDWTISDVPQICTPVRMPSEDFYKIKTFPDPVFNKDTGHYKGFTEVYGKEISEDDRPSKKRKRAQLHASLTNVKNCGLMLCCDECGMWRLIYAQRRLSKAETKKLNSTLDGLSFSCGAPLKDLELDDSLS